MVCVQRIKSGMGVRWGTHSGVEDLLIHPVYHILMLPPPNCFVFSQRFPSSQQPSQSWGATNILPHPGNLPMRSGNSTLGKSLRYSWGAPSREIAMLTLGCSSTEHMQEPASGSQLSTQ